MTARKPAGTAKASDESSRPAQPCVLDLPMMVLAADREGRLAEWNDQCQRVLGYDRREMVGAAEGMDRLFPDANHRRLVLQQWRQDASPGETWQWEMTCKDGTLKTIAWTEGSATLALPGWHRWAAGADITPHTQAIADLRISQQWLKAAFEHNLDGINVVEHDPASDSLRLVMCNDRYVEMSGRSRDELMAARNIRDFLATDASPDEISAFRQARQGDKPFAGRASWVRPDGKESFFEWSGVPITVGGKRYIVGIDHDVTERRLAEKALQESESRFRSVLAASSDLIYRQNLKSGTYDYVSPSCLRMLGFTCEEFLAGGLAWATERFAPEDHAMLKGHIGRLLAARGNGHKGSIIEYQWRHKDGSYRWLRDSHVIVCDDTGRPEAIVGSVQDITSLKAAEQALRQSEQQYRGLFENSPTALCEIDFSAVKRRIDDLRRGGVKDFASHFRRSPQTVRECVALMRHVNVNQAMLKLYRVKDLDELNEARERIFIDDTRQAFARLLCDIAAGETSYTGEAMVGRGGGQEIHVSVRWSAVPNEADDLSQCILSFVDITQLKQAEQAMRTSEQRFRSLFEDSPTALFEIDFSALKQRIDDLRSDGVTDLRHHLRKHPPLVEECIALTRFTNVNLAALKLYQMRDLKTLQHRLGDIFTAESRGAFADLMCDIADGHNTFSCETVAKRLDGQKVHLSLHWSVAPYYAGDVTRSIMSLVDITQLKETESKLRQSELRYRGLFEAAPIALWQQDFSRTKAYLNDLLPSGESDIDAYLQQHPEVVVACSNTAHLTDINKAAVRMYEAADKADFFTNITRLFVPEGLDPFRRMLVSIARNETYFEAESVNRTLSGRRLDVLVRHSPMDGYNWSWVITSVEDITDRKNAERALRASEEKYRALAEGTNDIPYSLTAQGVIRYIGPQFARYGVLPTDAVGCSFLEFVIPEDRHRAAAEFHEALAEKVDAARDYRIRDSHGRTCWIEDRCRLQRDDRGTVTGVNGVLRDVTKRKNTERALAATHKQLLRAREEERRRLAAELHDSIGQQLVALHLSMDSVLAVNRHLFDDATAESLTALSGKCNSLIREIRSICHGLYPATLESLGLAASLRQLAGESHAHTNIQVHCPARLESRRFSPEVEIELFRISQEAVSNARRHGRAENIDLELELTDGRLTLAIIDDGGGFDAEGDYTHGIGLSTMRERARAVGGDLRIDSLPGRTGVTISVTVPHAHGRDGGEELARKHRGE